MSPVVIRVDRPAPNAASPAPSTAVAAKPRRKAPSRAYQVLTCCSLVGMGAARRATATAGRPISWYVEQPTSDETVLWLWPSELEDSGEQAAAAVGISVRTSTETVTILNGDRRKLCKCPSLKEAKAVAERRLARLRDDRTFPNAAAAWRYLHSGAAKVAVTTVDGEVTLRVELPKNTRSLFAQVRRLEGDGYDYVAFLAEPADLADCWTVTSRSRRDEGSIEFRTLTAMWEGLRRGGIPAGMQLRWADHCGRCGRDETMRRPHSGGYCDTCIAAGALECVVPTMLLPKPPLPKRWVRPAPFAQTAPRFSPLRGFTGPTPVVAAETQPVAEEAPAADAVLVATVLPRPALPRFTGHLAEMHGGAPSSPAVPPLGLEACEERPAPGLASDHAASTPSSMSSELSRPILSLALQSTVVEPGQGVRQEWALVCERSSARPEGRLCELGNDATAIENPGLAELRRDIAHRCDGVTDAAQVARRSILVADPHGLLNRWKKNVGPPLHLDFEEAIGGLTVPRSEEQQKVGWCTRDVDVRGMSELGQSRGPLPGCLGADAAVVPGYGLAVADPSGAVHLSNQA